MRDAWMDGEQRFLGAGFPLPIDRTFDTLCALENGVSRRELALLAAAGLLRRELRGVYVAAQVPHDMATRIDALTWVITDDQVVCDRTAAWLHGIDILPRSARWSPPPLDVCSVMDTTRSRRHGVRATRRALRSSDVQIIGGLHVTSPQRTALDLGRMLPRLEAIAALDGFRRLGCTLEHLVADAVRFRGFRGVVQLRALLALSDPRSGSPGESALRLCWHDAGLPWPTPQHEVANDHGTSYFIDVADPPTRFAGEYDGERNHTSMEDRSHDRDRRRWMEQEEGWHFEVFTKHDIYPRSADPVARLSRSYTAHRRTGLWLPRRRDEAS